MANSRITPYRNGPYLIRGDFTLVDQDGEEIETRRRTIALCRCGASRTKPFCDGTHKTIGFRAQSGSGDGERGRPA
jgi:CDGSH-type Zn-finger protein